MRNILLLIAYCFFSNVSFSQKDTTVKGKVNIGTLNGDILKDNAVKNVYKTYKIYKIYKVDSSAKEPKISSDQNFTFNLNSNKELSLSPKQGQFNKFFIGIPKKEWDSCGLYFIQPNIMMMQEEGEYFNNGDTLHYISFQQPLITKDYPCILGFSKLAPTIYFGDITSKFLCVLKIK